MATRQSSEPKVLDLLDEGRSVAQVTHDLDGNHESSYVTDATRWTIGFRDAQRVSVWP